MADVEKAQPAQSGTVEGQQLASLFDVDIRHVREMGERGILVRVGRNRYDFVRSVRGYVKHFRELAAGHKSSTGLDNQSENALFTRERRRKLQLDGDTAAAKLIPVDLVEAVMVDHIKSVRAVVLGWPNLAQSEMPHLTLADLAKLKELAERCLRDNTYREIEETKMHPEIKQYIDEKRGNPSI